ncbi:MAG: OmpP1/FadL family transporter [Pirellulales bacterium]
MHTFRTSALIVGLLVLPRLCAAQGLAASGVGPVNQSMAGAATACPIDAAGALMWNPASISGLASSEVSLGFGLVFPQSTLSSRLDAGSFGPQVPPTPLAGADASQSGTAAIPYLAFAEKIDNSCWTYGLGVFGIGGFRVNYPSSYSNPILMPQPPDGFGLGHITSDVEILQIAPTLSYAPTNRLSVGIAPTISLAKVGVDPVLFAPPDDANGDGVPSYPEGRGSRSFWGGGFQCGVYYIADGGWHFGAAVKTPQWFEDIRFYTVDEQGQSHTVKVAFTYPTVVSLGTAYSGLDDWILATDVRLFDFANADGFRQTGFAPDGSLMGLGWSSIFAVSCGAQYQASEWLHLRLGYSYNQNPISDFDSGFNVASPGILQHFLYCGATIPLSCWTEFSAAYIHGFENSVSGPIQTPAGAVPGSQVASTAALDALSVGIAVKY